MLIIIFTPTNFKLYLKEDVFGLSTLELDGREYNILASSLENQGFIGFFDWLRSDENTIVGIRLCAFEHEAEKFLTLPYLNWSIERKCFELFFSTDRFDENISGDQDFGNNYVYKSEGNEYLITFGLDHLEKKEYQSLVPWCS